MKQLFTLLLLLLTTINLFSQTDGITYQAVIIGPDVLELPGVDSEGNYLPTSDVSIRFTIYNSGNELEFTEDQDTTTDEFGRINLIIGAVKHDDFEKISWDGTAKDLAVQIDFNDGNGFVDMSREVLTFVPYAYHRNITATGTLDVDDDTFLNRELTVNGPTTLNSTLTVNDGNETSLTGPLTVDGETNLENTFNVNGQMASNLSGNLTVGDPSFGFPDGDVNASTTLNGSLNVIGQTTVFNFEANGVASFGELEATSLTVNGDTHLEGGVDVISDTQVKITSTLNGSDLDINNYPLLVEGGNQGIAIKVEGNRANSNNFISFWDTSTQRYTSNSTDFIDDFELANDAIRQSGQTISGVTLPTNTPTMWGRIEGEKISEFGNNADYSFDQSSLDYDIYDADLDLAWASIDVAVTAADLLSATLDWRPCIGFGVCSTSPGPVDVAFAAAEVIIVGVKLGFAIDAQNRAKGYKRLYDYNKRRFRGVTYASGAGDYAEYLLRSHINEKIVFGDVVGVKGGKISKNTIGAERVMVVSYKPIVLGALPQASEEHLYEKVAFMGQVPVKVYGQVNVGDYIVPSGKNDGVGIALPPSKITSEKIKDIVGVAWEANQNAHDFNMVNVAVGLNKNDNNIIVANLEKQVSEQAQEITDLKNEIAAIYELISKSEDSHTSSKTQSSGNNVAENSESESYDDRKYEIIETEKGEAIYWEVTKADFEKGLKLAEEQMRLEGVDIDNHLFWKKIKTDPAYKTKVMNNVIEKFDKQIHYHKTIDKKGGH